MIRIEIWSDVVCPFCYIGKRHLEKAIEKFGDKEQVEITWRSFLLDPETETNPGLSINEHLAARKGWSLDQTREINKHVTEMAAQAGLTYDFDAVVVANSVKAHRLLQMAKRLNKADAAKEALLSAYFVEGKNIDDDAELRTIATALNIDAALMDDLLDDDTLWRKEVFADAQEAQMIGARGVPFFVFNRQYAISGAQPVETFTSLLEKLHTEAPQITIESDGDACDVDGNC